MATVIDSLVVELGLDPKGAKKGAADFRAELKKTRDAAGSGSKEIEAYGKRAASFFSSLRNEAIGLFLAFQGASSITGFVSDLVHGDAATGRFAGNIGMATDRLSAWQLVVAEAGGDAKDATTALGAMQNAYQSFLLTGDTGHNFDFAGLGVTKDIMAKGPEATLLQLAKAAETMPKTEFYARAQRLGIPDSVINTLEKGRGAVEALVEEKRRDGAVTQAQSEAAIEYERQLAKITAHIKGMLRPEIYKLVDGFDHLLSGITSGTLALPPFGVALGGILTILAILNPEVALLGLGLAAAVKLWNKAHEISVRDQPGYREFNPRTGKWEAVGGDPADDGPPLQMVDEQGKPFGGGGGGAGGGGGRFGGSNSVFNTLARAAGFTPDQAAGIRAGIAAEGGGLGMAANGAFGIGQWRGDRQRKLFAKYGRAPSMMQQLQFLFSELNGGDHGGASVHRGGTADDTMVRYLRDFMRPQGAHNERYGDLVADVNRGRAALRNGAGGPRAGGGHTSITVQKVEVNTNPKTAEELGKDMRMALRRRMVLQNMNRGLDH